MKYNSAVKDEILVRTKNGKTIWFPVNNQGLRVKGNVNKDDVPPPVVRRVDSMDSDDEEPPPLLRRVDAYDDKDLEDEDEEGSKADSYVQADDFTHREVARTRAVRKLYHNLRAPGNA